jgi:hypothetical protein
MTQAELETETRLDPKEKTMERNWDPRETSTEPRSDLKGKKETSTEPNWDPREKRETSTEQYSDLKEKRAKTVAMNPVEQVWWTAKTVVQQDRSFHSEM